TTCAATGCAAVNVLPTVMTPRSRPAYVNRPRAGPELDGRLRTMLSTTRTGPEERTAIAGASAVSRMMLPWIMSGVSVTIPPLKNWFDPTDVLPRNEKNCVFKWCRSTRVDLRNRLSYTWKSPAPVSSRGAHRPSGSDADVLVFEATPILHPLK